MPPPNVILLVWHDAGDWFGHNGHPSVRTPGVDRLAAEGVRFSNCFSACAICSPSRAAMMTGRLCQRNGVMGLTNAVFDNRIDPRLTHLSRRFKAEGYHTSLLGVQHECAHEHVGSVIAPDLKALTDPWPSGDALAPAVADWVEDHAREGRPFFGQIGTYDAHLGRFFSNRPPREGESYPPVLDDANGLDVPPWLGGSEADRACVAALQGGLRRGDLVVQRLLDALDRTGLRENTLVVMAVDHGIGLARAKGTCYDAGTRVSWIVSQPGTLPQNRTVDALATHVDLLPTLAGLLGWHVDDPLDGVDFSRHVRGDADGELNDAVFSHMVESQRSVRTGRHRLIRNFRPPRCPVGRLGDCGERHAGFEAPYALPDSQTCVPSAERPLVELYDAGEDPSNLRNLAADPAHVNVLADLDRRLLDFLVAHDDFVLHEHPTTPWCEATRADLERLRRE